MSSSNASRIGLRIARGLYTRFPIRLKNQIESVLSPVSFRWFTRGIISKNLFLGETPYRPVSIVIPSYNDFHLLKPLLKSLQKTLTNFEYEIIISDDFCEDSNSERLLGLQSQNIQVILTENRTGFSGAVNRGIHVAKYDVILLNSDMIALDYWAENLQSAAYNVDPKIGLVSPHLLYPTGRIQYGGTFHASVLAPQWFSHIDQGKFANDKWANVGKYVAAISGACVYIKRELLDLIHGLDEGYWLGFEDVDLAYTARELGYRSYLEPSSKMVHLESATRGKVQGFKEYESLRRFWDKWQKSSDDLSELLQVDLFLRENAPQTLQLQARRILESLQSSGIPVSIVHTNRDVRIDESAIDSNSSRRSYKISLDKGSIETVWLASLRFGVPVLYIPSLVESDIDLNSPVDMALFKPEFTIFFGNPVDQYQISSRIPWAIEKTTSPLALIAKIAQSEDRPILSSASVRLIEPSEQFALDFAAAMKPNVGSIIQCTESEFLHELLSESSSLKNEFLVFTKEFESISIPLTLFAKGIVFISVFSERTKLQIMDGFNTYCFNKDDPSRASWLISSLIASPNAQTSLRENGYRTLSTNEQHFARNFMESMRGRSSEILPLSE